MIKFLEVRNFEVLDGIYEFGEFNKLSGRNGSGKTAIGRAVLFCYTGRDVTGSQSTDHLVKEKEEPMSVKITTDKGLEIERRQTKTTKTIKVNGKTLNQDEFEKMMPVGWDVFASAFFTGFFNLLPEMQKRELFMSITPKVDKAEVFSEMVGIHPSKVLIDWDTPIKALYEKWNEKRKGLTKDVADLGGRLTILNQQREGMKLESVPDVNEYRAKKVELTGAIEAMTLNLRQHDIWKSQKEIQARLETEYATEEKKYQQKLGLYENELEGVQQKTAGLKKLLSDQRMSVQRAESELGDLQGQLSKIPGTAVELKLGNCPTCEQKVSETRVASRNKVNEEILSKKKELTDQVKLKISERDILKKRSGEMDVEIARLERPLSQPQAPKKPTVKDLGKEPTRPNEGQIVGLKANLEECNDLIRKASFIDEQNKTIQKTIDQLAVQIQQTTEKKATIGIEIELTEKVTEALHPQRGIETKIIEMKMKTIQLEGIEFVLRDYMKNGTAFDCFKVTANGIAYDFLSEGQKIKVSIRIAALIDHLIGKKVNMRFVDNVDLMDGSGLPLIESDLVGQVFLAKVSSGDLLIEKVRPNGKILDVSDKDGTIQL